MGVKCWKAMGVQGDTEGLPKVEKDTVTRPLKPVTERFVSVIHMYIPLSHLVTVSVNHPLAQLCNTNCILSPRELEEEAHKDPWEEWLTQ